MQYKRQTQQQQTDTKSPTAASPTFKLERQVQTLKKKTKKSEEDH